MVRLIKTLTLLLFTNVGIAAGACSGAFVSSDGYIATAAHCYGKKIFVVSETSQGVFRYSAQVIATDFNNDVMILKISTQNQKYFSISLGLLDYQQAVGYIGYPGGKSKQGFMGRITDFDNKLVYFTNKTRPGASGAALFNTSNQLIGIVTVATYLGPVWLGGGAAYSQFLYNLAVKDNIPLNILPNSSRQQLGLLIKQNRDKVVLLEIMD